jgi:uncharacterized delta-60 repeat protein
VRLNTDGSFDSSFGTDGKLITQLGAGSDPDSWADALALQPDGKLVVAGEASDTGGRAQLLVARLNADGSLDSSLGTGGKAVTQLGTSSSYSAASYAFALALQPDGKFVVAGKASDGGGHFQFLVARLNADGSIDPSFGTDGKLVTQLGAGTDPFSYAIALARQPDGKLVVAGGASESGGGLRFLVARLTGDEPPAPSFTAPPVAPRLTHVSQSHRRWREARALPRIARLRRAPLGTTFRFSLNEPSRVRFGFSRKLPGRRAGGRCVAVTRRNRHARRCTRSAGAGGLSFSAAAGFHTFRFQGRISRLRKLKPGRYTLTITATGAAGQRATARLAFVIVKS